MIVEAPVKKSWSTLFGGFSCLIFLASPVSAVTLDWVGIGGPGNDAFSGYGSVAYNYFISKYETTNAEYAEFLNAVAATDTHALYDPNMQFTYGGIVRSGNSGSYTYSVIAGREDLPVTYISFYDAMRFANWLDNGQPTGAQDSTTTEDGAYTITPAGITANSITRNPGATVFLPTEDEWCKAAYYDVGADDYYFYPASSDLPPVCDLPGSTPNTANCGRAVDNVTYVGSYTSSSSPNRTFDQAGNVTEWNERIYLGGRGSRGGGFTNDQLSQGLLSSNYLSTTSASAVTGFRVAAAVPEPGTGTGLLVAVGVLSLLSRNRVRG